MKNKIRSIHIKIQVFFFRVAYYSLMTKEDYYTYEKDIVAFERYLTIMFTKCLLKTIK